MMLCILRQNLLGSFRTNLTAKMKMPITIQVLQDFHNTSCSREFEVNVRKSLKILQLLTFLKRLKNIFTSRNMIIYMITGNILIDIFLEYNIQDKTHYAFKKVIS